jgi:alpha-N-arabinofuranosidase
MQIKNPILSGFYPDPSACAVGDKFYLVNSSFSYFPGVPIFESTDLKHWHQIGNILDRESQLPLKGAGMSRGIFAPTIRYHEGTFYMITTNVDHGGNFVVTATDPAGPWSEPHYIPEAWGIDPSLFFDDDGKCYYIGTRPNPEGVGHNGDWYIYIQELDLETWHLIGEYKLVWNGAMRKAEWPEGPHLYKKDGYYYILHAEGGTGPAHAVCVARSKELWGPYENNLMNPIFTHRHLGKDYPIRYVGHADLIEDTEGNWYAIMLASRPCEWHTNLGRETFLAKVTWEDGWPVFNAGIGILEDVVTVPLTESEGEELVTAGKDANGIPYNMVMLRNPVEGMAKGEGDGFRLKLLPYTLAECEPAAYLGVRQKSYHFTAKTTVTFTPEKEGEAAGLAVLQSEAASVAIVYGMFDGKTQVRVIKNAMGTGVEVLQSEAVTADKITFAFVQKGQMGIFSYDAGKGEKVLVFDLSTKFLSTESAGGFVGCTVGMYATANGEESTNTAYFSGIDYVDR